MENPPKDTPGQSLTQKPENSRQPVPTRLDSRFAGVRARLALKTKIVNWYAPVAIEPPNISGTKISDQLLEGNLHDLALLIWQRLDIVALDHPRRGHVT